MNMQARLHVLTGSSAGGFGAAFNYGSFRPYFPKAKGFLVDDSGPLMKGNAIPKALRDDPERAVVIVQDDDVP